MGVSGWMFLLVPAYQVVLDRRLLNGCVCVCFIKSGSKLKFCQILKDFQIFLHLKIPWNIIVRKQAINDNLQCSVAAYLKCDQWGC